MGHINFRRDINDFVRELQNNLPLQKEIRNGQYVALAEIRPRENIPFLVLAYDAKRLDLRTRDEFWVVDLTNGRLPIRGFQGGFKVARPLGQLKDQTIEKRVDLESYFLISLQVARGIRKEQGKFGVLVGNNIEGYPQIVEEAICFGREYREGRLKQLRKEGQNFSGPERKG